MKQGCLPFGVGRGREASLKAAGRSGLVLPWVSYRSAFITVWPAEVSLHPPRVAKLLLFAFAFESKGLTHPSPSCPAGATLWLSGSSLHHGPDLAPCVAWRGPLGSCLPVGLRGACPAGIAAKSPLASLASPRRPPPAPASSAHRAQRPLGGPRGRHGPPAAPRARAGPEGAAMSGVGLRGEAWEGGPGGGTGRGQRAPPVPS